MRALTVVCLLLFAVNSYAEERRNLGKAKKPDDQSFIFSWGYSDNSHSSHMVQMKYLHPLFQDVKFALVADYTRETERSEILGGLQIYPIKPPVYFALGAGASKNNINSSTLVITTGLGVEYNVSKLWYLDLHGGRDWESGVTSRWTILLGLGKRF